LPRLALTCDAPDLCLLSSWDYKHVPPCPAQIPNWYFPLKLCLVIRDGPFCLIDS
jgi:hypothetical protein